VTAGTSANVIAGEATLEGTIRTTLPEVRRLLHEGLRRIARAAGELHGATVKVELAAGNAPVINGVREAQMAKEAAEAVFGAEAVVEMDHPSLGSEDFSLYLKQVPGCYVRFGARAEHGEYVPLHSPAFDIDEDVLRVGAAFFDSVARRALVGAGA
jgi:hippurate hydrolase